MVSWKHAPVCFAIVGGALVGCGPALVSGGGGAGGGGSV